MKRFFSISFFVIVIFVMPFMFCSCEDETDNGLASGVPTSFTDQDGRVIIYSYTDGNRLSKITYSNSGESISFGYEGQDLVKCSFTHGSGLGGIRYIEFSKKGSTEILAKIRFTDSEFFLVDTIEVGAKGYPNVIRPQNRTVGGDSEQARSEYWFVLDESSTKIAEKLIFRVSDSHQFMSKTVYDYDNKPGTASLINCPKWFSTYFCNILSQGVVDNQLLNCVSNIEKRSIYIGQDPVPTIFCNTYTYGDDGFPLSMVDGALGEKITIKY